MENESPNHDRIEFAMKHIEGMGLSIQEQWSLIVSMIITQAYRDSKSFPGIFFTMQGEIFRAVAKIWNVPDKAKIRTYKHEPGVQN